MERSQKGRKLKACVNCTNAKTKCTPYRGLSSLCERCQRLGKACEYAEAAPKPKRGSRATRQQQLEAKVDSLVRLLANNTSGAEATPTRPASEVTVTSPPGLGQVPGLTPDSGVSSNSMPAVTPTSPSSSSDLIDTGIVSLGLAKELFTNVYRKERLAQFPFVTLSPTESFTSMRQERPLLLQSIIAVCLTHDPKLQRKAGSWVTQVLESRMALRTNYNLDLLQAIMIHVTWYQYFFHPETRNYFLMLQFCVTLVHELGLDRDFSEKRRRLVVDNADAGNADFYRAPPRTSEEKRALLGTYYLISSFTRGFRKPTAMTYTKYMEKCCEQLVEAQETTTDSVIKLVTRIQNLCNRVNDTFTLYDVENSDIKGHFVIQALVNSYLHEFELLKEAAEAQGIQQAYEFLELDLLCVKVWLQEASLHRELWTHSSATEESNDIGPTAWVARSKMAWSGIEAAKCYLNRLLRLPTPRLLHLTSNTWQSIVYVLIVMSRLIFLDYDVTLVLSSTRAHSKPTGYSPWEPRAVARELGIHQIGENLIKMLASVSNSISSDGTEGWDRDVFFHFGLLVNRMLKGYTNWTCQGQSHASSRTDTKAAAAAETFREVTPGTGTEQQRSRNSCRQSFGIPVPPTPDQQPEQDQLHTQPQSAPGTGSSTMAGENYMVPDMLPGDFDFLSSLLAWPPAEAMYFNGGDASDVLDMADLVWPD